MKKVVVLSVVMFMLAFCNVSFANLNDTKGSISQTYGEYHMVIDDDNQLWTKADWETKGVQKAQASAYVYYFNHNGIGVQMEVQYESEKENALVRTQRFTPNSAIKIKDFRYYFPELVVLLDAPTGEYFTTDEIVTRDFLENTSPITLGLLVKSPPAPKREGYYTLVAFNIEGEGTLIRNRKYIDPDTYVREFVIKRVWRSEASEKLNAAWTPIKKFF